MLVLGLCAVLVVVLVAALHGTSVVADLHRARGAADRAALAAAVPLTVGGPVDCAGASALVRHDGGVVTGCDPLADGTVVVSVAVGLPPAVSRWPGVPEAVTARARAGVE